MEVIFMLIPLMLFFGFLVVIVFIWMAKNGHFDDLDGTAVSIFMDDEYDDDDDDKIQKANNNTNKSTEHKVEDLEKQIEKF